MKNKLAAALLFLSAPAATSQTLVANLNSGNITSTVYFDNDLYHYEYSVDAQPFDKHDISNITIDLCSANDIINFYGDDPHIMEFGDGWVKFDSIEPEGSHFVFGFYSAAGPGESIATMKAATKVESRAVLAPVCIPEPAPALLGAIGFVFLLRRRRA